MTPIFLLLFQLDPGPLAQIHEQRIARLAQADGPESPSVRGAERDLGLFWLRNGQPALAEARLRRALPDTEAAVFLAEAVAAQRGRESEAESLFLACRKQARCVTRLAEFASRRGDAAKAIAFYREALRLESTPTRQNDLAQALQPAGEWKEAEALFRAAARTQAVQPGPKHPETATTWNNLATLLLETGRAQEAEIWQRRAHAVFQATLGPRHVRTGLSASNLAETLVALGRTAEALPLRREAYSAFSAALPPDHPWVAEARAALTP